MAACFGEIMKVGVGHLKEIYKEESKVTIAKMLKMSMLCDYVRPQ
jgi:hypothetical protein